MITKQQLLIVEDDRVLGEHLQERLRKESYEVRWARSCAEVRVLEGLWRDLDLVILDVGLPDGSGFDLAAEIRTRTSVPLVFMTAHGDSENRLRGYELGAEEFIPKPFHLRELLLRVRHVLDNHTQERILNVNGVQVDWRSMVVKNLEGGEERLTFKDYRVLKLLVDSAPRPVSRDEILDKIWGEDQYPSPRSVDNTIVRLRQVLRDHDGLVIRSVRGVGYQWVNKP